MHQAHTDASGTLGGTAAQRSAGSSAGDIPAEATGAADGTTLAETAKSAENADSAESIPASLTRWARERGTLRAFSFVEFSEEFPRGVHRTLTWGQVDRRARAIGARVAELTTPGERVAILAPQGLDFVLGFLGCLYAGAVAVPMFTPGLPGHEGRLAAVLADCGPSLVLTSDDAAESVREHVTQHAAAPASSVLVIDEIPTSKAEGWAPRYPAPEDVAYLQYTSGSTRTPSGVVITHGNVVANAYQAMDAFAAPGRKFTTVGWLPLFHDMGLVLSVAAPVVGGSPSVLMDPVAFLRRPVRWLQLLSVHANAVSAAPNFAFDFAASRVSEEERHDLRLNRVAGLINGSEPVRPETVDRFQQAFGPCGLPPEVHCPSYGLAEATVFVAASPRDALPRSVRVDRNELAKGRMVPAAPQSEEVSVLSGCGVPVDQRVCIADPETGLRLAPGQVGEICIQGANVGRGYWGNPAKAGETFGTRLLAEDGTPLAGGWLRTGDLGAFHDGELFVTGRRKDLIIVDGRNHYPQDLELTAQETHPAVRRHHVAAFSVPCGASEEVVVVAEHSREFRAGADDPVAVGRTVREALAVRHGLRLADFVLVSPGTVPRTTSGKVSRTACRDRYLSGELGERVGSTA